MCKIQTVLTNLSIAFPAPSKMLPDYFAHVWKFVVSVQPHGCPSQQYIALLYCKGQNRAAVISLVLEWIFFFEKWIVCALKHKIDCEWYCVYSPVSYTHLDVYKRQLQPFTEKYF